MPIEISNKNGFIFTTEDILDPGGKNNLSAFASSFQRTLYKEEIYPPISSIVPSPIDNWYLRGYFGRVDREQNSIVLRPEALKQIESAATPIYALDFVADAFRRFSDHMAKAVVNGAVSKKGNRAIIVPKPIAGYTDPTLQFKRFHEALARAFIISFRPDPEKPIDNFKTFVSYYGPFLKSIASILPITKTALMLSYRLSPMSTGLSISISNHDAANDRAKYQEFISDPNYVFYTNVAKRFGLLVHKNKPWVLTADLFTSPLSKYLNTYLSPVTYEPITRYNFFQSYYLPTHLGDINELQEVLLSAYQYLVAGAPSYSKQHISNDGTFKNEILYRQKFIKDDLRANLDPKLIIDLYLDLRQAESNNVLSTEDLHRLRITSYQEYKLRVPTFLSPYQRTAEVINRTYRNYIYPKTLMQLTGRSKGDIYQNGLLPREQIKS